jgi:hypothetical protein
LEKGEYVVGKPTTFIKKKATQSQKISAISILKDKRQKKHSRLEERSDSAPKETIGLSPEPASQVEKTHDLNM